MSLLYTTKTTMSRDSCTAKKKTFRIRIQYGHWYQADIFRVERYNTRHFQG